MKWRIFIFLGAMPLASPVVLAQPEAITLSTADQARLGISTLAIAERTISQTFSGIARVLDVGPLAALDAGILAARARLQASARNAARLEGLAAQDQAASQEAFEAAQAQAAQDAAQLDLSEHRVALEWGQSLAAMGVEARTEMTSDIAAGKAALLRVDAPGRDIVAAAGVTLAPAENAAPAAARLLGPAASVDPRLQSLGLLVVVRGKRARELRPGAVIGAEIDDGERLAGMLLPRTALVRIDGATWVYVKTDSDSFERRQVVAVRITKEGWLVTDAVAPGEEVVDHGAGSLLAVERGATANEAD